MGELPDQPTGEFQLFATRWLPETVAAFLRAVRDPALPYDLATETLAAARLRCPTLLYRLPTRLNLSRSLDAGPANTGMAALTLGALRVVFGDSGTSPLYACNPPGRWKA